MGVLKKVWKKLLYLWISGSSSFIIACAYGVPMDYNGNAEWKIAVRSESNEPIEGLQVTILEYEGSTDIADTIPLDPTDSDGLTEYAYTILHSESSQQFAHIKDQDGDLNGGHFADTVIQRNNDDSTLVRMKKSL